MKLGIVALGVLVFMLLPTAVSAEQRPAPEATQHALDELANAIAQGKITVTPTPTPTITPSPTATSTPIVTEVLPLDTLLPIPTPVPSIPSAPQDDPIHGYLRQTDNEYWLELALPQGRWLVSGTCDLKAWDTVWLWTDDAVYLNNCPIAANVWQSATPCSQDEDGTCDIQLDQSYWDYLGSLPTPIPTNTPQPVPTLLTHINVISTIPPAPPQSVTVQQPTPITRYVQSPPQQVIQTVVITKVTTATPTITPSPTSTQTPSPTATETPTPTEVSTTLDQSKPTRVYSEDTFTDLKAVGLGLGIVVFGCICTIGGLYFVTNR